MATRRAFTLAAIGTALAAVSSVAGAALAFVLGPLRRRAPRGSAFLDLGPVSAFEALRAGRSGPEEVVVERTVEDGYMTRRVKEKSVKAPATEEGGENPDKDVPSLLAYVEALGKDGPRFSALPQPIRVGGAAIDREDCRQCHQLYGEGGRKGPALQHLLGKRDRDWLVAHFKEPKKLVPGSKMPPFRFLPDAELSAMSDYLLALP